MSLEEKSAYARNSKFHVDAIPRWVYPELALSEGRTELEQQSTGIIGITQV
jgi:hypothetical protein